MTDPEIDRLLRDASLLTDTAAAALDLDAAEAQLLEEIMTLTDDTVDDEPTLDPLPAPLAPRRRPRVATLVAVAAAGFLVAVAVGSWRTQDAGDDVEPDVATEPQVPAQAHEGTVPRLLADSVPAPFQLTNTMSAHSNGLIMTVDDPDEAPNVHTAYYSLAMPGPAGVEWFTVETAATDEPLPEGDPVTVRGHEGRLSRSTGDLPSITVAWDEAPGVRARVSATNSDLTVADVLAIAESLRAASEEEWEQAVHLNDPADEAAVQDEIPDDATGWLTVEHVGGAVYGTPDGRLCAFRVDQRGRFPDVCGDLGVGPHLLKDRIGWPSLLFGVLPDGATTVVATRAGTDITAAPAGVEVPPAVVIGGPATGAPDGPRLYAVALGLVPDTLTFLDDAGAVVHSVALDIEPEL